MKRSMVILGVCDLVLFVVAVIVVVVSPTLRTAGTVGLCVAALMTVALALVARRSPSSGRRDSASRQDRPGTADFDEATALRNQPTWRDDVEGRGGPKW